VYTGYKILVSDESEDFDEDSSPVYKLMKRALPLTADEGDGKMTIRDPQTGKKLYTRIFVVISIIATTDIVFALDSIPAAFGITRHMLVIVTSNILAVIGLRAMFFMLMHAVGKFRFLQQGISFVLMFIGLKMLVGYFNLHVPTELSLGIIAAILGSSIALSLLVPEKEETEEQAP
jgi:tellurite resistance protein TerC